jgi:hypothetical protein
MDVYGPLTCIKKHKKDQGFLLSFVNCDLIIKKKLSYIRRTRYDFFVCVFDSLNLLANLKLSVKTDGKSGMLIGKGE